MLIYIAHWFLHYGWRFSLGKCIWFPRSSNIKCLKKKGSGWGCCYNYLFSFWTPSHPELDMRLEFISWFPIWNCPGNSNWIYQQNLPSLALYNLLFSFLIFCWSVSTCSWSMFLIMIFPLWRKFNIDFNYSVHFFSKAVEQYDPNFTSSEEEKREEHWPWAQVSWPSGLTSWLLLL